MQVPSQLELDIVKQQLILSIRATSISEHNNWMSVMEKLLYRLLGAVHACERRMAAKSNQCLQGSARALRQSRRASRGGALQQGGSIDDDDHRSSDVRLLPRSNPSPRAPLCLFSTCLDLDVLQWPSCLLRLMLSVHSGNALRMRTSRS
jgi:hypothetical protein